MSEQPTSKERYVPGDWVFTEGKSAVALSCPQIPVLYENGTIEWRPIHCVCHISEEPNITLDQVKVARQSLERRADETNAITPDDPKLGLFAGTAAARAIDRLRAKLAKCADMFEQFGWPAVDIRMMLAGAADEKDGWRLIEGAPKDGSEVLLRVELRAGIPGKQLVGHYQPGGHCISDHPAIEGGWYFWNGCMFDRAARPTHWMPLPPCSPVETLALRRAPDCPNAACDGECYPTTTRGGDCEPQQCEWCDRWRISQNGTALR